MRPTTPISAMRDKGEPTLPLINIVFLMLIFFLVTAQMARPLDPAIALVNTEDDAFVPPPDAVVVSASGDITFRGLPAQPDAVLATLQAEQAMDITVRILPDRRAPAPTIIELAHAFERAGADAVFIVTGNAL